MASTCSCWFSLDTIKSKMLSYSEAAYESKIWGYVESLKM